MQTDILILDVDGTLTQGGVAYGTDDEIKEFNIKDGLIISVMAKLGISVVFLTGRRSAAVERRAMELGAEAIQGVYDKLPALQSIFAKRSILPENAAYIGDDLNDYAAMKICGFRACPADAAKEIKDICCYVSMYKGGQGAVRDIGEHLLKTHGYYDKLLELYGVV